MIQLTEHGTPQLDTVHHCRAEALLSALDSNSTNLIVTSPPYGDLRLYNGFSWNFQYIAQQSYRVLKQGGVLVWVVGDSVVDGSETMTCFKQALFFRETVGFRLHDTMIYAKDGSPFPESNRYLQTFEFMFVFSKGSPRVFNALTVPTKYGASATNSSRSTEGKTSKFKYELAKPTRSLDNVWYITSGYMKTTKDIEAYQHPAMFPEALAERHILTWSNPGDIVLDYFSGSGTTAKMARKNGRRWLGCDISGTYVELARRRLAAPYTPSFLPQLETA